MTPEHDSEYRALHDLLDSAGWKLFRDAVMKEIVGDFENDVTRALDNTDAVLALDRMRQVAAIRKAGLRWLKIPHERLSVLESVAEQPVAAWAIHARRPVGV